MPELPDVTVYIEHLARRLVGAAFEGAEIRSPALLRTADPPLEDFAGRRVSGVERMGKRIVVAFEDDRYLVFHLMIAGRFHWRGADEPAPPKRVRKTRAESPADSAASSETPRAAMRRALREAAAARGPAPAGLPAMPGRGGKSFLAGFRFSTGILTLTEASTRQRASLHALRGAAAVHALDPGGIEPLLATPAEFRAALTRENHTLKRALTDPRFLSGIGNAYSDEILHRAQLSPLQLTSRLDPAGFERLRHATRDVLTEWVGRLRALYADAFPEKVTAFRPEMAVHGKFKQPCPVCGAPVQRIVYADNETNYCANCQTGGRLLADRALSRLLHDDWPRTLEAMEG